jgi:hypothetical protein
VFLLGLGACRSSSRGDEATVTPFGCCAEFSGFALGFFKAAAPSWIDRTGDGAPNLEFPARPLAGLLPVTAVALEPEGAIYLLGSEGIYAQTNAGFVLVLTVGRTRTTCSC